MFCHDKYVYYSHSYTLTTVCVSVNENSLVTIKPTLTPHDPPQNNFYAPNQNFITNQLTVLLCYTYYTSKCKSITHIQYPFPWLPSTNSNKHQHFLCHLTVYNIEISLNHPLTVPFHVAPPKKLMCRIHNLSFS